MTSKRIIVIGAGASGLIAAGQAALAGAETVLLEKMSRPARKLRITGKGRCNITNVAPVAEFISHFGKNGRFLRQAFARFFTPDLLAFFQESGIETVTERGGRVFPVSNEAQEVVDLLTRWVGRCGVTVKTSSPVERLLVEDGRVTGVITSSPTAPEETYQADAVIVATGGASYPATGSTGDGYRLAESVGHSIEPIRPALVPLKIVEKYIADLDGLNLRNVAVTVWMNGKKKGEAFGELGFTHFGLTGPIILTISREVVDALRQEIDVELSIDFKPALDHKKLDARLLRDLDTHARKSFSTLLKGLLPVKIIPLCMKLTNIPADRIGNQITAEDRKRLRVWLKEFRLHVAGHRPLAEAIVTAGGVKTREVDPRTMESRLIQGLYFCGEVLDIDADTGGYNLQAAFSTGWLAGVSAAEK